MLPLIAILGWIIRPLICACPQKSFNDPAESSEGHDSILAFSHFFGVVVKSISVWTLNCCVFLPWKRLFELRKTFYTQRRLRIWFWNKQENNQNQRINYFDFLQPSGSAIACHSYICILLELFANSTRTTKGNRVGSQDGSLFKWNHPPTRKLDTHKIR